MGTRREDLSFVRTHPLSYAPRRYSESLKALSHPEWAPKYELTFPQHKARALTEHPCGA
jgi:hypothetical protein